MHNSEPTLCAICGVTFTGFGNNPAPFSGNKCCDDCNRRFVLPARLAGRLQPRDYELLRYFASTARMFTTGPVVTPLTGVRHA